MKIGLRAVSAFAAGVLFVYALAIGSAYYLTSHPLDLRSMFRPPEVVAPPARTPEMERAERRDIRKAMDRIACEQTALFVMEHMPKVPAFPDKFALFDRSLEAAEPVDVGLFCEFGVGSGVTIKYLASKTDHVIHGFDSFEGLPEDWRTGYAKGSFAVSQLPAVPPHVRLHKGWFDASLPSWMAENAGPVAFLHMDADLYSSTKTVLDLLGDRITPGTVIQFDEYFNYPGWKLGEHKAFTQFVRARGVEFEYLGYCDTDEQVAVRIVAIGPPKPE